MYVYRTSGAEVLVAGGPSKTWIVANSLVTITTSGQGGGRSGSCWRCASNRSTPHPSVDAPPPDKLSPPQLCSCWCRGWAEITIRRPSGNISWLMRVQNRLHPLHPSQLGQRPDSQLGLVAINLPSTAEKTSLDITAESAKVPSRAVEDRDAVDGNVGVAVGVTTVKEKFCDITAEVTSNKSHEMTSKSHDTFSKSHDITSNLQDIHVISESYDTTSKSYDTDKKSHDVEASDQAKDDKRSIATTRLPYKVNKGEIEKVQLSDLSTNKLEKSASKVNGSITTSPSSNYHTSQSWCGDEGVISSIPLSPKPSSYSTHFPLEHLPPLLSYDEADDNYGRSPCLHGNSEVLSEEEQLTLHASMSDITTSHSDQSEGEGTPPLWMSKISQV